MTTWTPTRWKFSFADEGGTIRALDNILSLDGAPIRVNPDGTLTEMPNVYAPDSLTGEDDTALDDAAYAAGWELWSHYTLQQDYDGPVMHPSEYIGGDLATDILHTPGVYAVASVDDVENDGYPVGWVLMIERDS